MMLTVTHLSGHHLVLSGCSLLAVFVPCLLAVPCRVAGGPRYAQGVVFRRGLPAGTVPADAAFWWPLLPHLPQKGYSNPPIPWESGLCCFLFAWLRRLWPLLVGWSGGSPLVMVAILGGTL